VPSPAITGMAKQQFGPEVPVDTGGSALDRLVGVSRASTIGRCVPPNCRGGLTGATAADSRRYDSHGRVESERWEPGIEPRTRGLKEVVIPPQMASTSNYSRRSDVPMQRN